VPGRLAVVGGGGVAVEMATAWWGLGSDVTLLAAAPPGCSGARFYADGYTGRARMIVDLDGGYLHGVTFVGPGVSELLHSATIAVAGQVPVDRLWHAVPCFPTISEVWLRLLEAYRDS
jgi:pyruvate/2-oxoglutarate dehydrogenase complex dihydrolipoamide dehydrogenase (E3) component